MIYKRIRSLVVLVRKDPYRLRHAISAQMALSWSILVRRKDIKRLACMITVTTEMVVAECGMITVAVLEIVSRRVNRTTPVTAALAPHGMIP